MSAASILVHFDRIVEAPHVIPHLRRLVLDLALRGRLSDCSRAEESTADALARIAQERTGVLAKAGSARQRGAPQSPTSESEIVENYSATCRFERLANVAEIRKGLTGIQSALAGKYPLVVTADARSTCDHYDFEGPAAIVPMVSSTGHGHASLKRLHYQEGKFALGSILCAVLPADPSLLSARFVYEYLSAFKEELLVSRMVGTANVSLTVARLGDVAIPLLPPAVQQRVAQLLTLCDELEAKQQRKREVGDRLTKTAVGAITSAESPEEFEVAWKQVAENLHILTSTPGSVAVLRAAILDLAVRGALTSGLASERPATGESPYALPLGWEWVRFDECFDIQGGTQPPKSTFLPSPALGYVRLLQIRDLGEKPVPTYVRRDSVRRFCTPSDIMLGRYGASVGKVFWGQDGAYNVALAKVIFRESEFNSAFVFHLLKSSLFQSAVRSVSRSAQDGFNKGDLAGIKLPRPPLTEQRRIVAKLDQLTDLCDELEARLAASEGKAEQLAEAIVGAALSGNAHSNFSGRLPFPPLSVSV